MEELVRTHVDPGQGFAVDREAFRRKPVEGRRTNMLQSLGWPVSVGTGGRTKWNRHRFLIPKTHALDAVCVGNMDTVVEIAGSKQSTLHIAAYGRGAYQRTRLTEYGFPRGYLVRSTNRSPLPCRTLNRKRNALPPRPECRGLRR
jgi:hypothetical protein